MISVTNPTTVSKDRSTGYPTTLFLFRAIRRNGQKGLIRWKDDIRKRHFTRKTHHLAERSLRGRN